jgi:mannose-1-phosphate guanylyltransferase
MLLAAGEGRRLGSITLKDPKPMLRVLGRPILEHNLRLLAHYGITEVVINLHHSPAAITDYFGDGSAWGMKLTYSYEKQLLGTAGAVKRIESFFREAFVVIYGDNLTTCDLNALAEKHRSTSALATLALFHREDVSASGVALLDAQDRIEGFIEKPGAQEVPSHWVNAGVIIFQPQVMQFIPDDHPSDFGFDVLPKLIAHGLPVFGYRMTEELWWIDTPEAFTQVRSLAESGQLKLI